MTADGFTAGEYALPEHRKGELMGRAVVFLRWDAKRCRHCFGCIAACPQNALGVDETGNLQYEMHRCIRCFRCASGCLYGALSVVREET